MKRQTASRRPHRGWISFSMMREGNEQSMTLITGLQTACVRTARGLMDVQWLALCGSPISQMVLFRIVTCSGNCRAPSPAPTPGTQSQHTSSYTTPGLVC